MLTISPEQIKADPYLEGYSVWGESPVSFAEVVARKGLGVALLITHAAPGHVGVWVEFFEFCRDQLVRGRTRPFSEKSWPFSCVYENDLKSYADIVACDVADWAAFDSDSSGVEERAVVASVARASIRRAQEDEFLRLVS